MVGNGYGLLKSNIIEYMYFYGSLNEWFYWCEGFWIVVVFYRKIRRVLCLRKIKLDKKLIDLKEENYFWFILNNFEFVKYVLLLFMGSYYMCVGEVVFFLKGFVLVMNEMCWSYCLFYRLDKEIVESCFFGVIMLDFCFVFLLIIVEESLSDKKKYENLIFVVEIKLKCGFFFIFFYIDLKKLIKCLVCYYCMF